MSAEDVITRYYGCFRARDKEGLRALLTPDLHHMSSFGEYSDRDLMLETIWPSVGQSWAEDLEVCGAHPELMVHYTVVSHDRPRMRMAERIRFRGDQIAEVEVFMGRVLEPPQERARTS